MTETITVCGIVLDVIEKTAAPAPGVAPGQLKLDVGLNGKVALSVTVSKSWYEDRRAKPSTRDGSLEISK